MLLLFGRNLSPAARRKIAIVHFTFVTMLVMLAQFGLMLLQGHVGPAYAEAGITLPVGTRLLFDYLEWMRTGEGLGASDSILALSFAAWYLVIPLGHVVLVLLGIVLERVSRLLVTLGALLLLAVLLLEFVLLVLPYFDLMQELLEGGGI